MKSKPKVLILIASARLGGPGKGILQYLGYARDKDFDYTLCNFKLRNSGETDFMRRANGLGFKVHLIEQKLIFDPATVLRLIWTLRSGGCNLLQTHGYKPSIMGFFAKAIKKVPWVSFSHGFTSDDIKIRLYNSLESQVIRYADLAVGVSRAVCDRLVRSGVSQGRVRLIYNAIDAEGLKAKRGVLEMRLQYGICPETKVIGVVGRLNPEKGHIVFLKALRQIKESYGKVKCLIIGEGHERENLIKFCNEYGLKENVIFTGYQEQIADFYQMMDMLVMPSFSEGLPNALLEAMLFGVPVIATSVGGIPEVVDGRNGILVPAGDHEAMAARVLEMLKNERMASEIGEAGKASLFPKFCPSHRADLIVGLYKEILQEPFRRARGIDPKSLVKGKARPSTPV